MQGCVSSSHDPCILCGCILGEGVEKRFKQLHHLANTLKKGCIPTPYVYAHVTNMAKKTEGDAGKQSVACCIACVNWVRRLEIFCREHDVLEDEAPSQGTSLFVGMLEEELPFEDDEEEEEEEEEEDEEELEEDCGKRSSRGNDLLQIKTEYEDGAQDSESNLQDLDEGLQREFLEMYHGKEEACPVPVICVEDKDMNKYATSMKRCFIPIDNLILFLGDPGKKIMCQFPLIQLVYFWVAFPDTYQCVHRWIVPRGMHTRQALHAQVDEGALHILANEPVPNVFDAHHREDLTCI